MVKRKENEELREIDEALRIIDRMKESDAFKNRIIRGFVEEKEYVLLVEHYKKSSEKVDSKED